MPTYQAPIDDLRFILNDVLDSSQLSKLPGYEDATPELMLQVLEEAGRMCEEVFQPLNQHGDAEGCRYENGVVKTPSGFKEAYKAYCEGGWPALACDAKWGGQGLPHTVGFILEEMMCGANLSLAMYPGLTHGAYTTLVAHGSSELQERYLPKLVDGTWTATMCLTEAHAGTDLGMIRTKAVPAGDGAYRVTGNKIFITAGEHDLSENIIHLVLAKLPDAPAGTKGISLFVVPKFLPTDDGKPGTRNGVTCGSIEHKMGIKGSATCVMNFDDAIGWLVGEPHKGMRAMFTMMNGARLGVGLQGLGLAQASYVNAVAYARERAQGRSLTGPKNPGGPADPIVIHADVRKNLLTMRAFIEGARALGCWIGMLLDVEEKSTDKAKIEEAEDLVALMTPVVKALFTDYGFLSTNLGLQIYGGHGYIREFGMEQFVRDARIGQIYEGTNYVQAIDLVGRKLPEGNGRLLKRYAEPLMARVKAASVEPSLAEFAMALGGALGALDEATRTIGKRAAENADEAGASATEYLHLLGLVALGDMWLQAATAATQRLAEGGERKAYYETKLKTARFFFSRMLPQVQTLRAAIAAGGASIIAVSPDEF